MTPVAETASAALVDWLRALDAEAWDTVADWLDEDVQLADELTTEWLRGRDRAGAYLRASEGIVTDIVSTPSQLAVSELGDAAALVTFLLHQSYRLDGDERDEHSTGSAIFRVRQGRPRLAFFHLAPVRAAGEDPAPPAAGANALGDDALEVAPRPADPPEFVLGAEIKRRRAAAGLSLRELGERTGLSSSFLSQVERSLADPSVSSLRQIASGLGIDVVTLLGRDPRWASAAFREGRSDERARVFVGEAGATVEGFAGLAGGLLEAYIVQSNATEAARRLTSSPTGEEFVFVLDGAVDVELDPYSLRLAKGDGVHLRSSVPHRVGPAADGSTRYLVVRTRARRS